MGRAYRCDRCEELNGGDPHAIVVGNETDEKGRFHETVCPTEGHRGDALCPKCWDAYEDFMNETNGVVFDQS